MDGSAFDAEYARQEAGEAKNTPVLIALFGQSGAEKSSVINAIVNRQLAEIRIENDVAIYRKDYYCNGLIFSDLPGYCTARCPASEYFPKFDVLKFDVFLCVIGEELRENDVAFHEKLSRSGKNCIFVHIAADAGGSKTELRQSALKNLHERIGGNAPITLTSCADNERLGDLINEIQQALSGAKQDRFLRSAAIFSMDSLKRKRDVCRTYALHAANASCERKAVSVPGVGTTADLSVVLGMMERIRADFCLTEDRLAKFIKLMPDKAPMVRNVLQFVSPEGAVLLHRQFSSPMAAAELGKYISDGGSIGTAPVSFSTARVVLYRYIDDCSEIASEMLDAYSKY